jgi:hypothetical protein
MLVFFLGVIHKFEIMSVFLFDLILIIIIITTTTTKIIIIIIITIIILTSKSLLREFSNLVFNLRDFIW